MEIMRLMMLEGYAAEIEYQPEIRQFRGRVVNLGSDGPDFLGASVDKLEREFRESLRIHREDCERGGREPETPGPVLATE